MILLLFAACKSYFYYGLTSSSPTATIYWTAISPDGTILATCLSNGDLLIYGLAAYAPSLSQTISRPNALYFAGFSDDNSVLVTLESNGRVTSYFQTASSPPTYSQVYSYVLTNSPLDICIAGDASYIFAGDLQSFHYFNYAGSGSYTYGGVVAGTGATASSAFVSCSYKSGKLAMSFSDKVMIYSVPSFTLDQTIVPAGLVYSVRLSQDLNYLICGGDQVDTYSLAGGTYSAMSHFAEAGVYSVGFSADSSVALVSSSTNNRFTIYSLSGGSIVSSTLWTQPVSIYSIEISGDNSIVVTAGSDGSFRLYVALCANSRPFTQATSCVVSCPTNAIPSTTGVCFTCTSYILGSSCLATCPVGFYPNTTNFCLPCTSPCAGCSSSATACTSCIIGNMLSGTTCVGCGANCHTCATTSTCSVCLSTFWLDYLVLTCDSQCPIGQFKPPATTGKCALCSVTCIDCTATECMLCAPNYFMDPSNVCYICLCSGCGSSCSGSCPAAHFQLDIKCYGDCPRQYFQDPSGVCLKCAYPCLDCLGATTCVTCQEDLLYYKEYCLENCPVLYYKTNRTCSYCFLNGKFLQIPDCQKYIPHLRAQTDSPSPFTSDRLTLHFTCTSAINFSTLSKSSLWLSFSIDGTDASRCFSYSFENQKNATFDIVVVNKNCSFSGLVIKVANNDLLRQALGMPIQLDNFEFVWQLSSPQLAVSDLILKTQGFFVAYPYLRYANIFPATLLLVPALRANLLLQFLDVKYPYQCHNLVALFASTTFIPNRFGFKAPHWRILQVGSGENANGLPLGAAALSGNFLIDSYSSLFWVLFTWLLVLICTLFANLNQYSPMVKTVQFRLHEAVSLPTMVAAAASIRHMRKQEAIDYVAVSVLALFLLYWVYYVFSQVNKIRNIGESSLLEDRLKQVEQCKSSTYQLKWEAENNTIEGAAQGLNPIYHRVLTLCTDSLIFLVFVACNVTPIAQAVILGCYGLAMIVKYLAIRPYRLAALNLLSACRELFVVGFLALSVYADIVYESILSKTSSRALVGQGRLDDWLLLGWPLSALYLLSLGVGLGCECVAYFWSKDESQSMLEYDLSTTALSVEQHLKNQNAILSLNRKESKYTVEEEVQTLTVCFDESSDCISLKVRAVLDLRYSLEKSYLSEEKVAITRGRVYEGVLNIISAESLHFSLRTLRTNYCEDAQRIVVRTFTLLDTSKLKWNEHVQPTNFYNLVVYEKGDLEETLEFKGCKALSFLPVSKSQHRLLNK